MVSGTLQFKLDDKVIDVPAGTVVRVAPHVVRSVWNDGPDDVELVIAARKIEDPRGRRGNRPGLLAALNPGQDTARLPPQLGVEVALSTSTSRRADTAARIEQIDGCNGALRATARASRFNAALPMTLRWCVTTPREPLLRDAR